MTLRHRLVTAFALLSLVVAACGSTDPAADTDRSTASAEPLPTTVTRTDDSAAQPDVVLVDSDAATHEPPPDDVEACPEALDPGLVDIMLLPDVLSRIARVIALEGQDLAPQLPNEDEPTTRDIEVELAGVPVEVLAGEGTPESIRLPMEVAQSLSAADLTESRVALFLHAKDIAMLTVTADAHEAVAFLLGDCAGDRIAFERFRQSEYSDGNLSELEDLVRLVLEPSVNEKFAKVLYETPPPVAWSDRDPWNRLIDPEETPTDILEGLEPFKVSVVIPLAWQPLDLAICTRVPTVGWNDCAGVTEGVSPRLEIFGWVAPNDVLEVWVGDLSARTDSMFGLAATITATDALTNGVAVVLADTAPTRAEIVATDDASQWVTIVVGD